MMFNWKQGIRTLLTQCTLLFQGYSYCVQRLRSNKRIFRCMFHFQPAEPAESYWDWTTLVLKKAIRKYMKNHFCMVDVGTGVVGTLALYAKVLFPQARIYAVDQFDFIVASARNCAVINRVPVYFWIGDLLNGIRANFDLIVFNPPYIDKRTNQRLRILDGDISRKRSFGGSDGCRTIDRFLMNVSDHLAMDGLVLLGANEFYIPRKEIEHLVSRSSLRTIETLSNPITMSYAFVMRKSSEDGNI